LHRQWILGRIATLLGHFWRDDDPSELTEAIARDWADIFEGLPQQVIHQACIRYLRDEPKRKPTPGAIYALCREMLPRPKTVPRLVVPEEARPPRVTAEQAERIMQEAGFRPRKFGGDGDA
jgi:hypothetical protein